MTMGPDQPIPPDGGQWQPWQQPPGASSGQGPGSGQGPAFGQWPAFGQDPAQGQNPAFGQGPAFGQAPGQYQQYGQQQYAQQPYGQQPGAYPPVPYPQGYQPQPTIVPKNPAISVLLSFLIPGLGSMLNDRANTGVIILVTYIVGWFLALFVIGFFIAFGAWIWGMIDAYQSAIAWNQARGITS